MMLQLRNQELRNIDRIYIQRSRGPRPSPCPEPMGKVWPIFARLHQTLGWQSRLPWRGAI